MASIRVSSIKATLIAAGVAGAGLCAPLGMGGSTASARPTLPNPIALDALSWRNFITAVAPSGTPGRVTYETWASDQDIYVSNPCPPQGAGPGCNVPRWPTGANGTGKLLHRSLLGAALHGSKGDQAKMAVQVIGPSQGCRTPIGLTGAARHSGFPATGCVGEEVRRDRASFDYLVSSGLWSSAGLQAFYKTSGTVRFKDDSLEVKADWIPVANLATWIHQSQDFVRGHFYTASAQATTNGPTSLYALTSMHISIRAPSFPDWVWANFENAYSPGRCDQTGCHDLFGAAAKSVPAKSPAWQQYGACTKSAQLAQAMASAKVAPVFANYCLTGTQTLYMAGGKPTLLGSPIIETLNANVPMASSSCISCHAGASFQGATINNVGQPIGPHAPPPNYRKYDFMWGLLFAS